jgi:hypothetical protein
VNDDELRRFERKGKAALAGAFAALLLTIIVVAFLRYRVFRQASVKWIGPCLALGAQGMILGAVMGVVGGIRRQTFRVTAIGSIILAVCAAVATSLQATRLDEPLKRDAANEQVWMVAAFVAFLSITTYAGALAAGKIGDDGTTRFQFSLGDLLLAFVPFAILAGYLQHAMQVWPIHHSTTTP